MVGHMSVDHMILYDRLRSSSVGVPCKGVRDGYTSHQHNGRVMSGINLFGYLADSISLFLGVSVDAERAPDLCLVTAGSMPRAGIP
jgi:hypothetical protein